RDVALPRRFGRSRGAREHERPAGRAILELAAQSVAAQRALEAGRGLVADELKLDARELKPDPADRDPARAQAIAVERAAIAVGRPLEIEAHVQRGALAHPCSLPVALQLRACRRPRP